MHLSEEDAWILSRGLLLVRLVRFLHSSALMGIEQLLATNSKSLGTSNAEDLGHALDQFYRASIPTIMSFGTVGVVGMFTGRSIGTPCSASPHSYRY